MKNLFIIGAMLVIASSFYVLGQITRQQAIEDRALTMNKECYDGFDIQFIVRGVRDGQ